MTAREILSIQARPLAHVSLGDVDNDGDLDAVSGKKAVADSPGIIGLYINRREAKKANSAPTPPTQLAAVRNNDTLTFSWRAGSDAQTPTPLLTYNLRVGTSEGGHEIFSGIIPAGPGNVGPQLSWILKGFTGVTYYWAVQTIDSAFQASIWSVAQGNPSGTSQVSTQSEGQAKPSETSENKGEEYDNQDIEGMNSNCNLSGYRTVPAYVYPRGGGNRISIEVKISDKHKIRYRYRQ